MAIIRNMRGSLKARLRSPFEHGFVFAAIMKSYQFGRQEDAHEFLRYFVDSMQTSLLFPYRQTK